MIMPVIKLTTGSYVREHSRSTLST